MTVILFIFVILLCVLVHEWGHYIIAKRSGMRVEEFGFGLPPRLFSWGKGETKYSINALPIGGFVRITGENGVEDGTPPERQFDTKPWYKKSAVLVAGVVMNFILALVLFTSAYLMGLPTVTPTGTPTVVQVVGGSPTEQSGIKAGDVVIGVAVDGKLVEPITTEVLHDALLKAGTNEILFTYLRGSETHTVAITPTDHMIGVSIEPIGVVSGNLFQSIARAWTNATGMVGEIFSVLGHLVKGIFVHSSSAGISLMGPVGLAKEVGTASTFGFAYLIAFIAMISINLAVLNILPFPALDGGRLVIVLGEAITKKKFSKKVVGIIHAVGFIVLIGLMVFLTIHDVQKSL